MFFFVAILGVSGNSVFILRNSESETGKKWATKRTQKSRNFWTLASRKQTENKKFETRWDRGACWGCTQIPGRFFEVVWPSREESQDPDFWPPWSPKTGSGNSRGSLGWIDSTSKAKCAQKTFLEATECREMVMLLWSPSRTLENTKQNFPRFFAANLRRSSSRCRVARFSIFKFSMEFAWNLLSIIFSHSGTFNATFSYFFFHFRVKWDPQNPSNHSR